MPGHDGNRTYDLWNTGQAYFSNPVWIYTLRVTLQTSYSPEYITPTQKKTSTDLNNYLVFEGAQTEKGHTIFIYKYKIQIRVWYCRIDI